MYREVYMKSKKNDWRKNKQAQRTIPKLSIKNLRLPYSEMSFEEKLKFAQTIGEEAERQLIEDLAKLKTNLKNSNPLQLLAMFSFYDLTLFSSVNLEKSKEGPLFQSHVELIQALILQNAKEHFDFKPVIPEIYEYFRSIIPEISKNLYWQSLGKLNISDNVEQLQSSAFVDIIRFNTQTVRNWGYPQQIIRILKCIFNPLDELIGEKKGIRITNLIDMCVTLMAEIESRSNKHMKLIASINAAKTLEELVNAHAQIIPDSIESSQELINFFKKKKVNLIAAKFMLISHSDLILPEIYQFTLDEFVKAYPGEVNINNLKGIIENWSYSFGDLANENSEHFRLDNPIWTHPIIKLNNDNFFIPICGLFLSFGFELMEKVFNEDATLKKKYEERRANFLEEEVERLLKDAFPTAGIYPGSYWKNSDSQNDKIYENDLLIIIDQVALIVESKAGKISPSARRGSQDRIKKTLKELLIGPTQQSGRFVKFLQNNKGKFKLKRRKGGFNEFDNSQVKKYYRINVTLDALDLISYLPAIQQAGFIQDAEDLKSTLTLSLADLEVILEILSGVCEKLHYFGRRIEIQQANKYIGDELDFLVFYLDTGFNLGNSEGLLLISGRSIELNKYFMQEYTKKTITKPNSKRSKWWQDILKFLEYRKNPGYTILGCCLLNVAYENQIGFERLFSQIKLKVRKQPLKSNVKNKAFIGGFPNHETTIAGFAFPDISMEERNAQLKQTASWAIKESACENVIVIGQNIYSNDYPYTVLIYSEKAFLKN